MDPDFGTPEMKARQNRQTWKNSVDYVFNLLGWVVGLGNVWRFPYLCFENGGGAFLVAYLLLLLIIYFPLFTLEASLGQLVGRSTVKSWGIIPLMGGIGYFGGTVLLYGGIYMPVVLSWVLRWIVASFSYDLPWITCGNSWNTESCVNILGPRNLSKENISSNATEQINATAAVTSVEEYWHNHILGMTSGLKDPGSMQWHLLACLTVDSIIVYFCLWKGIGWTSKIAYVTATLPIAMLVVIVVKASTLEGAAEGLSFYLTPNVTKLLEIDVWHDAASQVMFSLGAGTGSMVTLSGYNNYRHNYFRDIVITTTANTGVSLLAGFAIFPVLGYLSQEMNTTIPEVVESGPGLVFTVYPAALAFLPLPQLWCVIFFLMLLFLGIDSQFVALETLLACLEDVQPKAFKYGRKLTVGITILVFYLISTCMVMGNGVYTLGILDRYARTGWCLLFVTVCEFVTLGWLYGSDRLSDDISKMLGYELPRIWIKITSRFIGPAVSVVVLVLSLTHYKPLVADDAYPAWADVIGWLLTLSSILWIPGYAIYAVSTADGDSVLQKFMKSASVKELGRSREDSKDFELQRFESNQ